jgi:ADP-heptose:LPS heptosyltransferase
MGIIAKQDDFRRIAFARKADYLAGSFLCLLASGLSFILKLFSPAGKGSAAVRKVLFVKFSELGAIILAYPLMKQVKDRYPSADLFFVTFNRNKEVFPALGGIIPPGNIMVIRETTAGFFLDVFSAVKRLRREKIDIVFDLEFFSKFSAVFSFLTGAKKIAGFYRYCLEGLYRGSFITHKMQYNPFLHIAKNYLSFGLAVLQDEKNSPRLEQKIDSGMLVFPEYQSKDRVKQGLLMKLKDSCPGCIDGRSRIFIINPGEGTLPLREWPVENFIFLAELILKDDRNYIVIAGTEAANSKARIILDKISSPRCLNLVSRTSVAELMELFLVSEALISNDCGLAHLAALTPVKKFILFGPESPDVFGPLAGECYPVYSGRDCSPCLSVFSHRSCACEDNLCLKAIKPADVYGLIMEKAGGG